MGQKLDSKVCEVCGVLKSSDCYWVRKKNGKEWLRAECKDCTNGRRRHLYNTKNKKVVLERNKAWIEKNKDYKKEYDKQRLKNIREFRSQQQLEYHHDKKSDPMYRLKRSLRARFYFALVNNTKAGNTIEMIGCSIDFLKAHLESKFKEGMTWDNYGSGGWHVDHIIPCVKFDLSQKEEQYKCFNYTNLQPLWESENCAKGGRYE